MRKKNIVNNSFGIKFSLPYAWKIISNFATKKILPPNSGTASPDFRFYYNFFLQNIISHY